MLCAFGPLTFFAISGRSAIRFSGACRFGSRVSPTPPRSPMTGLMWVFSSGASPAFDPPDVTKIRLPVLQREFGVAGTGAAHRFDDLRQRGVEDRHQPGEAALDLLDVDDVGRVRAGLRAAQRGVLDLDGDHRVVRRLLTGERVDLGRRLLTGCRGRGLPGVARRGRAAAGTAGAPGQNHGNGDQSRCTCHGQSTSCASHRTCIPRALEGLRTGAPAQSVVLVSYVAGLTPQSGAAVTTRTARSRRSGSTPRSTGNRAPGAPRRAGSAS